MNRFCLATASLFLLPACIFGVSSDSDSTSVIAVETAGADGFVAAADAPTAQPEVDAAPSADTGPAADTPGAADVAAVDTGSPPDAAPPDVPKQPGCGELNAECWTHESCCAGFCSYTGFDYVPGACSVPQPAGSYCQTDAWCDSGKCQGEVCAPAQCAADGAECAWSVECCSGFCTIDGAAYVLGVCAAPQPLGSPCQSDAACAQGTCVDGQCSDDPCPSGGCPPECKPNFQECWSHQDCCTGFCTYSGVDYTPGSCQPRQPLGAYCVQDPWCQSGKCVDNACVDAACQAADAPCFGPQACCSGLCTWAGGEAPGACTAPQLAGAECKSGAWCQSGVCANAVCQPLPAAPSFKQVYKQVIEARGCTTNFCHGSPGAPLAMHTEQAAWDDLVGAPSTEDWCIAMRVVPGKPEESMLWQKVRPVALDGEGPWCGPKMPLGTQGLSEADAELIRLWITSGAAP
jgi:hypothetical protein